MGQLDPTRNPTQPVTRLTCNPIDPFKNDPFWPVIRFDPRPDWSDPNPTRPARFAMSAFEAVLQLWQKRWASHVVPNSLEKFSLASFWV